MPRPAKDDPRDRFHTFRFTEAEITRLRARARAAGRNLSSFVRMMLLERPSNQTSSGNGFQSGSRSHRSNTEGLAHAPEDGLPDRAPARLHEDAASRILTEQIRKVGVNLNQIATRMNERRHPVPPELTGLLTEIRALVRKAREP